MFKDVLVGIELDDPTQLTPALAYAFGLSETFAAHLDVLIPAHEIIPTVPDFAYSASKLRKRLDDEVHTRADVLASLARRTAKVAAISCDIAISQQSRGALREALRNRAKLHDITIVDRPGDDKRGFHAMVELCLFSSGRPMLVVPETWDQGFCCRKIFLAWDGSTPASRALGDSLPFIDRAECVEVLSIAEDDEMPKTTRGAEIAPHLMRHGVDVTITDLPRNGGRIGAILAEHALAGGGDLLVMGGYSRSPRREAILGGTTRYILDQAHMPVLMSH